MNIVEAIHDHRFDGPRRKSTLQLLVKWEGYPDCDWQQYTGNNLGLVGVVQDYLRNHNMRSYIPR